jgi:hypothetical protein
MVVDEADRDEAVAGCSRGELRTKYSVKMIV